MLIKDIVFVGSNWDKSREKAECKLAELVRCFPVCETCNTTHTCKDLFWVVEELKTGFLIKKYQSQVFSVCSLKCLFDHGIKKNGYYSIVVRRASGDVMSTGFQGQNAVTINDFADLLAE